jgi:hypothetical protein
LSDTIVAVAPPGFNAGCSIEENGGGPPNTARRTKFRRPFVAGKRQIGLVPLFNVKEDAAAL